MAAFAQAEVRLDVLSAGGRTPPNMPLHGDRGPGMLS